MRAYLELSHTFFGRPLESRDDRVFDLVEILDSLRGVDDDVGSGALGTEAPDLTRFVNVVLEFVRQITTADLEVLLVWKGRGGRGGERG